MYKIIEKFLHEQKSSDLLRVLRNFESRRKGLVFWNNKKFIDFSSNDYLGFSDNAYIKKRSIQFIKKYGNSSAASRLLSGDFSYHHQLEKALANLKEKESALLFGSGFLANVGVLPALVAKEDVIFADQYIHASLIDGLQLCQAKFFRFKHNDANHLKLLLKKYRSDYKRAYIVTESVFSMDGDRASIESLIALKQRFDAFLYVDEAHGTGLFGPDGGGYLNELGVSDEIDIIMGTLGKALGSYGAYVAGSQNLKDFLVNRARSFIFSTSLPPSVVGAALGGVELLKKEPKRRKKVLALAEYFRIKLQKKGFQTIGDTQIIPIIIGKAEDAVRLSEKLLEEGFLALPIRPPTVSANSSRLRFSLTYYHSKEQIDSVINCLVGNV